VRFRLPPSAGLFFLLTFFGLLNAAIDKFHQVKENHAAPNLVATAEARPGPDSNYNKTVSGGGSGTNYTFQSAPAIQAGTANPQAFTGVGIGTAASNRFVVVCVAESGNGPITAVTIGGISATKAVATNAAQDMSIWYANVTTGTTATIDLTSTTTFPPEIGIAVATITTATPTPNTTATEAWAFNSDPQVTTSALTISSNGVGVGCGGAGVVGTPTINNGGTLDASQSVSGWQLVMFHSSTSGSFQPSVSGYSFQGYGMSAASWGP
jgi:hypothetical protein